MRAVSRPAWYAVLSLPYLMEFPHECCEQTFSRYYANALGAFIANADPRIRATFDAWREAGAEALKSPLETNPQLKAVALEATPWVREAEHETAARARLGELFGSERLAAEQERCLGKLRETRNRDGLWPWFPGGPSSDSITLYILTGFARLNRLAAMDYPDFFADATKALDREVAEDVKRRLRLAKEQKIPFRVNGFDVRWLYLHSFAGVPAPKNGKDAELFVEHLRAEWPDLGLETQAVAATALKRRGEEALAREILASIKERGVLSDELGMYWKRPYFFSCSLFAAPVSTQALVVEAFREVTGDEASADACNVWLLKQKQTQDWTTTAATADAIYALVLGGGADLLAGDALAEVTLGGEKVPAENAEAGTGMWSHRYAAEEIKPAMGEIAFTGAGEKGVAWGGVHWSYFEDVLKVRAHEPKELRVEKKYYRKTKGAEGTRLAALGEALVPGDEIVARLEITSDRTYEFVHLSDERPACAEPVDVLSSYRWRDGVGYYQSTKDTATHYYIDRLNKGVFVLETSYRVQQRGGKGVKGVATKAEDEIAIIATTTTHRTLYLFTNKGRVFGVRGFSLPEPKTGKGKLVGTIITLEKDEKAVAIKDSNLDGEKFVFFVTKQGTAKRLPVEELEGLTRAGRRVLGISEGDDIARVRFTSGGCDLLLTTATGQTLRVNEEEFRPQGRQAQGMRGIRLDDGDAVVGCDVVAEGRQVLFISEGGIGKRTSYDEFTQHHRGGYGVRAMKLSEKTGPLVGAWGVQEDEEIIVITGKGRMVRIGAKEISSLSRSATGYMIVTLDDGDTVADISIVKKDDEGAEG